LGEGLFLSLNLNKGKFMTTIDLRSTQKVYKPKTDADKKIEEMEIRLKSITQTLNLILKKLDN
jgi:hypothetical protein|tara:strand:+ start:466 stop:654 length:189 start_codon:yes stop_codon:yes gene_type:complete